MGKEKKNHNGEWYFYECECGKETEYGIIRHKTYKEWNINSCCGNCNSANNIKYCPFCGKKITLKGN